MFQELGDFIRGAFANTVRAAIKETLKTLQNVALARSNYEVKEVNQLHLTAKSQVDFGNRYAKKMKQLSSNIK